MSEQKENIENPEVDVNQAAEEAIDAVEEAMESEVDLEKALAEAESKAAEHMDKLLRVQAEMENVRRRAAQDVEKARKFALEGFASDLLPILDSFDMGKQALPADMENRETVIEGFDMTQGQFLSVLEKYGVEIINPEGEVFNPELHQAATMQPSPDHESNTVITVFQKGFALNGRLLRPAMVVVAQ